MIKKIAFAVLFFAVSVSASPIKKEKIIDWEVRSGRVSLIARTNSIPSFSYNNDGLLVITQFSGEVPEIMITQNDVPELPDGDSYTIHSVNGVDFETITSCKYYEDTKRSCAVHFSQIDTNDVLKNMTKDKIISIRGEHRKYTFSSRGLKTVMRKLI
ncbi:hypothetical protein ACJW8F_13135 [Plesiomonas shigelloides]|uniref:hypothetical protein n=1 Tax=Plesiomonas shigelloides TaxID=703 RepID=UPI00387EFC2B